MDHCLAKEEIRHKMIGLQVDPGRGMNMAGRAAEMLRRTEIYKKSGQIFCGPSETLKQIRINILVDGKDLIMPMPALKEGFVVVKPYSIPFPKLALAVSYKGIERFGEKISTGRLGTLQINLLLTDCTAVDGEGFMVNDGKGFFDLACGILGSQRALVHDFQSLAVVLSGEQFVDQRICRDRWDIQVNGIVTAQDTAKLADVSREPPGICWQALSAKRIKKIKPLWDIYTRNRPEGVDL